MALQPITVRAEAIFAFQRYSEKCQRPPGRGNTYEGPALKYENEVSCSLVGSHNYDKCLRRIRQSGWKVAEPDLMWAKQHLNRAPDFAVPGKTENLKWCLDSQFLSCSPQTRTNMGHQRSPASTLYSGAPPPGHW
mmetsp:Transcript_26554/g.56263  ORF Transcript_26554/g.56263 Transcript_26554/m.56263 type:complete len:135 (+) Transcript_26554:434-838(+)